MTFSRVAGALALAVGFATGPLAVPAHADTASSVDEFLSSLDTLGIRDIDPAQAVAVGQSLCPLIAQRGQNTADVAAKVADAIGRPLGASTIFTGAAISFLCPKAVENVTNNLANGNPLIPIFGN